MRSPDFLFLFLENYQYYCFILFSLIIFFSYLIKIKRIHIIDPLFLAIVGCIFAYTVPVLLFVKGECSERNFLYFLFSEALFWTCFLLFSRPKRFKGHIIKHEMKYAKLCFVLSTTVYLFTSILTYLYVGIALFMEHRQEQFVDGPSGSGLLPRLSGFAGFFIIYYSYHMIVKYKRFQYTFFLILIVVNSILSGSKGAVLILLYSYFIYSFFYQNRIPHVKRKYYFLILFVPVLILMTYGEDNTASFIDATGSFLYRFIAFGDTYWYAYPNNTIDKVTFIHPFVTFFQGLLGPLRLIDYNLTDKSIGIQLFWLVEPSAEGIISGPNARLAVMGWCYFGWYGLLFSAFCGYLMAYLLYGIRKYFYHSFLGIFIFGYLYYISVSIITDFSLFLNSLSSFIINIIIYGGILVLISGFRIKYKKIYA